VESAAKNKKRKDCGKKEGTGEFSSTVQYNRVAHNPNRFKTISETII
jgi:hypothetical protein